MADVSDILGLQSKTTSTLADEAAKILADKPKQQSSTFKKPKGMSREVFGLLGTENVMATMQTASVPLSAAFRTKRVSALRGKWVWAPFAKESNSSMDTSPLFHWVKADLASAEYPYAKFNIHLDKVTYSDHEYESLLKSTAWTRSETDALLHYCHKYDLRWPVIVDRISLQPPRSVEDLQERYYQVVTRLKKCRSDHELPQKVLEQASIFDLAQEKLRRRQLDASYFKTREEEKLEVELKEELKQLDANMKKQKKSSKSSNAGGNNPSNNSNVSTATSTISGGGMLGDKEESGVPIAVVIQPIAMPPPALPGPGVPALQSTRLAMLESDATLAKSYTKKVVAILRELHLPEQMVPTKAVCDLYDQVRRDACALISLQNAIAKKEKELGKGTSLPSNAVSSTALVGAAAAPTTIAAPAGVQSGSSFVGSDATGKRSAMTIPHNIVVLPPRPDKSFSQQQSSAAVGMHQRVQLTSTQGRGNAKNSSHLQLLTATSTTTGRSGDATSASKKNQKRKASSIDPVVDLSGDGINPAISVPSVPTGKQGAGSQKPSKKAKKSS